MFKEHNREQYRCPSGEDASVETEAANIDLPLSDKQCSVCGDFKSKDAYYSKGSRIDSSCKACVLRKKKKSYRKQKTVAALKKPMRENSKILVFSEDQIEEKKADSSNVNQPHLENLLRQFTFVSICRNGEGDGKT